MTAAQIIGALLVYARVQACILALPVFSEQVIGIRVRVALACAVTLYLLPLAPAGTEVQPAALAGLVAAEALLGLALGLLVRLLFAALSIAATVIAQAASLSQIIGTGLESAPHPIGNLLHFVGLALIMALGFHLGIIALLDDSLRAWPSAALPDPAALLDAGVATVARAFSLALILASPFILGGVLYQAVSGVINRVMPSLPVTFIFAPAAIGLSLIALALLCVPILSVWADALLDLSLPQIGPRR